MSVEVRTATGPAPLTDLFGADDGEILNLPDGSLTLYRAPDLGLTAEDLYGAVHADVQWREETISLFGKTYLQPRLLAWYGDADANYRYSGKRYDPLPWTPLLSDLRKRISTLTGASYNSVLANLYRNERDSMGLHADDEPELGLQPVIASLSLGEERVFRLKHRHRKDLKPVRLPLTSGSLLVMAGDTQANWKHEVPKERRSCGPRINLTFRLIHPRAASTQSDDSGCSSSR